MRRSLLLLALLAACLSGLGQTRNQRLFLKDGSYQVVTQYHVVGDRVRYFSAERDEWEEIPISLVDWAATAKWAKEHAAEAPGGIAAGGSPVNPEAAAIDQEEQRERSLRAARRPEVAPGLRLPDETGVWALDTYRDQPELVALEQNSGNINPRTGHNVTRAPLDPMGGMREAIEIPGPTSKVQLHVNDPAIYVSLSVDDALSDPSAVTVDTHGASSADDKNSTSSPGSRYAVVRAQTNLRRDYRVVGGIRITLNGGTSQSEDVIPVDAQILPGKRWMKLTPRQPLTIGDYALMEILGSGEVNASVWDFRVDPQAPDNKHAIIPLERSP